MRTRDELVGVGRALLDPLRVRAAQHMEPVSAVDTQVNRYRTWMAFVVSGR